MLYVYIADTVTPMAELSVSQTGAVQRERQVLPAKKFVSTVQ